MLVNFTKNWSQEFLVKITKILARWQLELVEWPIFGKNYQNLVSLMIFFFLNNLQFENEIFYHEKWQKMPYKTQPWFGQQEQKPFWSWNTFKLPNLTKLSTITRLFWAWVKSIKLSWRMLELELNANNDHQGSLDIEQIPIIIIMDAWMLIKSKSSSRMVWHGANRNKSQNVTYAPIEAVSLIMQSD